MRQFTKHSVSQNPDFFFFYTFLSIHILKFPKKRYPYHQNFCIAKTNSDVELQFIQLLFVKSDISDFGGPPN